MGDEGPNLRLNRLQNLSRCQIGGSIRRGEAVVQQTPNDQFALITEARACQAFVCSQKLSRTSNSHSVSYTLVGFSEPWRSTPQGVPHHIRHSPRSCSSR